MAYRIFSKKTKIIFIGAGKIAHTLVPSLLKYHYNVTAVISRSNKSAKQLALKNKINFFSDRLNSIRKEPSIFFLTVPDDQIKNVAGKLSKLKLDFKNSLFIHTSGSETADALNALKRKDGSTASFHIMQTFPSTKPVEIKNCYVTIETGSADTRKFLEELAVDLKLTSIKISSKDKVYYHIAGVFAANFLTGNFFTSEKLFNKAGLTSLNKYQLMKTIIETTLKNIRQVNAVNSLSGPVSRGDVKTIKKHVTSLKSKGKSDSKIILLNYIVQSLNLVTLVQKKKRVLSANYKEIKDYLEGELRKIM
jgi:predicted short-subunit dehydrogenase-like oxidoreductase (DUF2520 family)